MLSISLDYLTKVWKQPDLFRHVDVSVNGGFFCAHARNRQAMTSRYALFVNNSMCVKARVIEKEWPMFVLSVTTYLNGRKKDINGELLQLGCHLQDHLVLLLIRLTQVNFLVAITLFVLIAGLFWRPRKRKLRKAPKLRKGNTPPAVRQMTMPTKMKRFSLPPTLPITERMRFLFSLSSP